MKTVRAQRAKRHKRVRRHVGGTSERPRLSVYRSNKHIYAQLIDDLSGKTLAAASTVEASLKNGSGTSADSAGKVGTLVAERAIERGIKSVVFDRGGFRFHGRVKAVADAAREKGLSF
jgi:large subunit ribosomal protein L18